MKKKKKYSRPTGKARHNVFAEIFFEKTETNHSLERWKIDGKNRFGEENDGTGVTKPREK